MEYLYHDSDGNPVHAIYQQVEDQNYGWQHLSKSSPRWLSEAAKALKDLKPESYPLKMDHNGVYKPFDPDLLMSWFDASRPWRPWIPGPAADNVAQWWNGFNGMTNAIITTRVLDEQVFSFAEALKIICLEDTLSVIRCCSEVQRSSAYPIGAPIPALPVDPAEALDKIFESIAEAEEEFSHLKRIMLEGIGFLWWWIDVCPQWAEGMDNSTVRSIRAWTAELRTKNGVILDLTRDAPSMNIPLWVAKDVPVAYLWSAMEDGNPRFTSLSPRFYDAYYGHVESLGEPLTHVASSKIPRFSSLFPYAAKYDIFLQNPWENFFYDRTRNRLDHKSHEVYIVDFEGWKRRLITDPVIQAEYRQLFKWRAISIRKEHYLLHWRYRPIARQGSMLMEVDYSVEDPKILRELLRFEYAPIHGVEYQKEKGIPMEKQSRPALESRSNSPAGSKESTSLRDRIGSPQLRPEPYRRTYTISSSSSDHAPREADHATTSMANPPGTQKETRSLESRLSDHNNERVPSLVTRLSSPPRNSLSSSAREAAQAAVADVYPSEGEIHLPLPFLEDQTASTGEPSRAETAREVFREKANDWYRAFIGIGGSWRVPEELDWNDDVLRYGILYVQDDDNATRLKLHTATSGQSATLPVALTWAIETGIPFRIGYPEAELDIFAPPRPTEVEHALGTLYQLPVQNYTLKWEKGSLGGLSVYKALATSVLVQAHARSVVFYGGILHWITRKFRGDELIAEAMQGPSIRVSLHRQGWLDTRHPDFPRCDTLTVEEQNAIYGLFPGEGAESDRTIWPTEECLLQGMDTYNGCWTRECDAIFNTIWKNIENETHSPLTKSGWAQ
ncbi:hypothetical protein Hypma_010276 [Hypsizygus marmoreus]|uniref:Uncharacterized protein n=1 Tax=Hypsizygus marmoreus TaxID=39966 RepID=A0A369JTX7_HYPMA|nr:hypothetical protein Hypma_010276 [Hypsizygus marmoreus]